MCLRKLRHRRKFVIQLQQLHLGKNLFYYSAANVASVLQLKTIVDIPYFLSSPSQGPPEDCDNQLFFSCPKASSVKHRLFIVLTVQVPSFVIGWDIGVLKEES